METKRIMFLGPSGIGKTTLSQFISTEFNIPFISSSFSDMVPKTKHETHREMLEKDKDVTLSLEWELLHTRYDILRNIEGSLVTDRSFIDNICYATYKLSYRMGEVELMEFYKQALRYLQSQCTHIIFCTLPHSSFMEWRIEENGKRVENFYFQWMIYTIMENILLEMLNYSDHCGNINRGTINMVSDITHRPIQVLWLDSLIYEERIEIIKDFLRP